MHRRSFLTALPVVAASLAAPAPTGPPYGRVDPTRARELGLWPCHVYCDGVRIRDSDALDTDDIEGWVLARSRHDNGQFRLSPEVRDEFDPALGWIRVQQIATHRVYGRISLIPIRS